MKLQLDKETYILGKQIGTGNFATVYSTSDPQFVAKICFKSNPKAFKAFQIELDVLSSVKSEGILKLKKGGLSTLDNKQIGLLFIENCSKGSLLDFMLTMAKYYSSLSRQQFTTRKFGNDYDQRCSKSLNTTA